MARQGRLTQAAPGVKLGPGDQPSPCPCPPQLPLSSWDSGLEPSACRPPGLALGAPASSMQLVHDIGDPLAAPQLR